jgi:hypothetical protein
MNANERGEGKNLTAEGAENAEGRGKREEIDKKSFSISFLCDLCALCG